GDGLRPYGGRQRSGDLVAGVARMKEMIRVGDHVAPNARDDLVHRTAVLRDRLVEACGETGRRMRRRNAPLAAPGLREIFGGERYEGAADGGVGIGFDSPQNLGRHIVRIIARSSTR